MSRTKTITILIICIVVIAGLAIAARFFDANPFKTATDPLPAGPSDRESIGQVDPDSLISDLIDNEVLLREAGPLLGKLSQAVKNLELPDEGSKTVFSPEFNFDNATAVAGGQIWPEMFEGVKYFRQAKFYAIRVTDRSGLPEQFCTKVGFEAVAKTAADSWRMFKSKGIVTWTRSGNDSWEISDWDFDPLHPVDSPVLLFEDRTAECLSNEVLKSALHSKHFEIVTNATRIGMAAFPDKRIGKYAQHVATGQHPAIAVVDIDSDGWDDLYLIEQWRDNVLLRNRGDGTFEDATFAHNLGESGHSSSGIFADFDNDGDQDLILGQSLDRSVFLENQGGIFVDRSKEWFEKELPFLVTSISVADYNNDGLLDLYLSTYGFPSGKYPLDVWGYEFLEPSQVDEIKKIQESRGSSRYLNAIGPPNYLFVNRGGRFELSEHNPQLELHFNTFQSTWCDFDADGDQDLYVSNDFAPDYLFRNDGDDGFSDVTLSVGDETMMGFGMGASWGDYDLDGRPDLYVSNMYSKAGIRITEHFDGLDKRFRRSADGNRLYRNGPEGFELVSSNEKEGLDVIKAGWSWGGQFVDINNDCFLDLYVASGYFTAPDALASDKDL